MNKYWITSIIAIVATTTPLAHATSESVCKAVATKIALRIGNATLYAGVFKYSVVSTNLISRVENASTTGEGTTTETFRVKLAGNGFSSELTNNSMTVVLQESGDGCSFKSANVNAQ